MRRIPKRLRPSPAMIIALLALFVAMGGSVYAASKLSGKSIKKGSEPGNRIKKNTLTGTQIKESSLGTVPKATNATNATNAGNATTANGPVGWAAVSSTGSLEVGRNVSQGNISAGSANYWCFSGLSFPFRAVDVTVDYWNGTFTFSTVAQASVIGTGSANLGGTGCPAGTQAFVHGWNANASTTSPIAFFIQFYN
jgi:hypothetical protein